MKIFKEFSESTVVLAISTIFIITVPASIAAWLIVDFIMYGNPESISAAIILIFATCLSIKIF